MISLLVPFVIGVFNYWWRPESIRSRALAAIAAVLCSRSVFLASLLLALVIVRAPALLTGELNPDEGQFLTSAQKLLTDPVFFRAVDCGTSGPGNIYPLALPALFGITPDYAASRVVALAILLASIWFLYRALALLTADRVARLAILPLAGIFAVLSTVDFRMYSSEVPSLLILAASIYTGLSIVVNPVACAIRLGMLGLLAGLSFFSKMQALPLILAVVTVVFVYLGVAGEWKDYWRFPACVIAGAAVPFVVNAVMCTTAGVWGDFWTAYIESNRAYVNQEGSLFQPIRSFMGFVADVTEVRVYVFLFVALLVASMLQKFRLGLRLGRWGPTFLITAVAGLVVFAALTVLSMAAGRSRGAFVAAVAILLSPALILPKLVRERLRRDHRWWVSLMALALIGVSLIAVYIAHRPFPHYLLLCFIPIAFGMASLVLWQPLPGEADSQPGVKQVSEPLRTPTAAFLSLYLASNLALQFYLLPPAGYYLHSLQFANRTIRPPEGDFIRSITSPGARIVVWGWNASLYLASGRLPATRDTNMRNFFLSSPEINAYYRRRFASEVRQHPPELFVDATVPGTCCMGDHRYRFEGVPEVKSFVDEHYSYVGSDTMTRRYYLRNDRAAVQHHVAGSR
jgi:hypothetical protein